MDIADIIALYIQQQKSLMYIMHNGDNDNINNSNNNINTNSSITK